MSSTIKVHGVPYSGPTMRVLACLYEKDIPFELLNVDIPSGAHKRDPVISINPFGKIPAFEDGDLKLFESRAIVKYIATEYEKKGTKLVGGSVKERAEGLVWMEVEAHQFDGVAGKLVYQMVIHPFLGKPTDDGVVKEQEVELGKILDVYEVRLGKNKYLGGGEFGLADLCHLPYLHYLSGTNVKKIIDGRPSVSRWCTDLLARPAWAKVLDLHKPKSS